MSQKIRDRLRDRSITIASQSGAAQILRRRNSPDRTSYLVPVVVLGVVCTAIAYPLGISGVARLRPSYASLMGLGEVLCAVVAAWLLLGEAITPAQAIGGGLVLLGLALAGRETRGPADVVGHASWPDAGPAGRQRPHSKQAIGIR